MPLSFEAQIPGLIHYGEADGLNTSYTYGMNQDKNGFIWIGTDNGIFRFDGKEFKQYNEKDGLKNLDVLSAEPLPNNELFLLSFLNDFAYLKNNKVINSDHNKELKKIQSCYNPIIANTKSGLYLCNLTEPKNIYLYKNGKIKSLPLNFDPKNVTSIGFDTDAQILYIKNKDSQIEAYNILKKSKTSCNISLKKVDYALKKNNFYIKKIKNKIDIYTIKNTYDFVKINTCYINEDIAQIIIDNNDRLWICLDKGGALYFDKPLSSGEKLSSPVRLLEDYIINHIMVDTDNNVWFSTRKNGIFFVAKPFFKNYINLPLKNNSSSITAIAEDGKNIILGYNYSRFGIFRSNTITDITLDPDQKREHKAIFAKDNILILGLTSDIFIYNLISKKRKRLNKIFLINKLTIESNSVFWASTNSGISRIEFRNGKTIINNFTQTDGLPSDVVTGCVIRKDTIYIATSKGLGILSINQLLSQQKFIHKKVVINSVSIGNKDFFDFNQKLVGQFPDNEVKFHVSFPDYSSQGKISYKYQIAGLNNNWQISNSPTIILNALPPGNYTLKIFGLGYNHKQSDTLSSISFEIKPRFWQTWWFRSLFIFAGAVLLMYVLNLLLQKQRNKKLKALYYEKKIAELELQAIKAQINPHFIYNCLNSIQFLLYKKNYTETENYLNTFSQMIRKTLYYSEKTLISIKEEVEYLSFYLNMEKLRLKEQFDYDITISEAVNKDWVIPSLLIQPFVENAIKHGISGIKDRKGNIHVLFDYTHPFLNIVITDNGVGIGSKMHSIKWADSFGVKLSKKRIETFRQLFEINITLEIDDLSDTHQSPGTQIKLQMIPYENKSTSQHH